MRHLTVLCTGGAVQPLDSQFVKDGQKNDETTNAESVKVKNVSEQLYTQGHKRVCKVIRWHICKNVDIPITENMWENEPKAITENIEVPLTYDLVIPSGVNIENKSL